MGKNEKQERKPGKHWEKRRKYNGENIGREMQRTCLHTINIELNSFDTTLGALFRSDFSTKYATSFEKWGPKRCFGVVELMHGQLQGG